jgi:hypothetical protein
VRLRVFLALAGLLAGGLVALAGGAHAKVLQFSLTFTGKHVTDPSFPAGLHHEGRFTASAPFCPAGSAIDTRHVQDPPLWVERTHTCDDGSGSITVSMPDVTGEHGGRGVWRIIAGTANYERLRGSGTYVGQRLSGDPADFLSITYQTTWNGVVDFDTDPPALNLAATATKLKLPQRTYLLSVRLLVPNEPPGSRVNYSLLVQSRGQFVSGGSKLGSLITPARATLALKIRPLRTARVVRVSVRASDPVGNEGTANRTVRLP